MKLFTTLLIGIFLIALVSGCSDGPPESGSDCNSEYIGFQDANCLRVIIREELERHDSTTVPKPVKEENTPTTQPFSHENCQYPDRWSNPENGCDNSDPASPECIDFMYSKQAEQQCIERL